jgi:hypothetical protein
MPTCAALRCAFQRRYCNPRFTGLVADGRQYRLNARVRCRVGPLLVKTVIYPVAAAYSLGERNFNSSVSNSTQRRSIASADLQCSSDPGAAVVCNVT